MRNLALVFIEIVARKQELAVAGQHTAGPEAGNSADARWFQARLVWNLKHVIGRAEDRSDRTAVIDNVLQKCETVPLLGTVVQRIRASVR